MVAVTGARLGHSPPGAPPPLVFLAVPLGDMLVFALLVGAALRFRRRSDIHKRLMLLGCVGLLTAAVARIPLTLLREGGIVAAFSRSEEHTSELQSLMRTSYADFCLKKKHNYTMRHLDQAHPAE